MTFLKTLLATTVKSVPKHTFFIALFFPVLELCDRGERDWPNIAQVFDPANEHSSTTLF